MATKTQQVVDFVNSHSGRNGVTSRDVAKAINLPISRSAAMLLSLYLQKRVSRKPVMNGDFKAYAYYSVDSTEGVMHSESATKTTPQQPLRGVPDAYKAPSEVVYRTPRKKPAPFTVEAVHQLVLPDGVTINLTDEQYAQLTNS